MKKYNFSSKKRVPSELSVEEICYVAESYGRLGAKGLAEELNMDPANIATLVSKLRNKGVKVEKRGWAAKESKLGEAVSILLSKQ